jgi:hypothetical protein
MGLIELFLLAIRTQQPKNKVAGCIKIGITEPIALKKAANNNHESAGFKKSLPTEKTSPHSLSLRLLRNDASVLLEVPLWV